MPYSMDLRERVVNYVKGGGSKAEAARRYEVSEATVYLWLKRKTLEPTVVKRRHRKIDWKALENHVHQYPEATLQDRAKYFRVNPSAIWYALKQLQITRKKNSKST
jgi:putative transposase